MRSPVQKAPEVNQIQSLLRMMLHICRRYLEESSELLHMVNVSLKQITSSRGNVPKTLVFTSRGGDRCCLVLSWDLKTAPTLFFMSVCLGIDSESFLYSKRCPFMHMLSLLCFGICSTFLFRALLSEYFCFHHSMCFVPEGNRMAEFNSALFI